MPPNAYAEARTFRLSYAPIEDHHLGQFFTPISPLITIANGGGYSDMPMVLKIPAKVPQGSFAMAFLYDKTTGELEGLPLIDIDNNSVTIATRHFTSSALTSTTGLPRRGLFRSTAEDLSYSDIVVSKIPELDLGASYTSNFQPGVDDWQFPNYGSYIAPEGHCAGQSMAAVWYFNVKKGKGSPALWGRFDNDGNTTRTSGIWEDDVLGYKFCSTLQKDMTSVAFHFTISRSMG